MNQSIFYHNMAHSIHRYLPLIILGCFLFSIKFPIFRFFRFFLARERYETDYFYEIETEKLLKIGAAAITAPQSFISNHRAFHFH